MQLSWNVAGFLQKLSGVSVGVFACALFFLFFSLWWLMRAYSEPLGRVRILSPFSPQTRAELISIVAHCSPHLHKAAVWTSQIITQSALNRRPAPSIQWASVLSHLPERTPLLCLCYRRKSLQRCSSLRANIKAQRLGKKKIKIKKKMQKLAWFQRCVPGSGFMCVLGLPGCPARPGATRLSSLTCCSGRSASISRALLGLHALMAF